MMSSTNIITLFDKFIRKTLIFSVKNFICPRCGNEDIRYIGNRNGVLYCRKCLAFNGEEADNNYVPKTTNITLPFSLSEKQKETAEGLVLNYRQRKNALLHAVTGAGKTELVYPVIKHCLDKKLHVGFAVPRVDIVIDLLPRFKQAFRSLNIVGVYGGHHNEIVGDIIILTTHQLYRYRRYFDLLIMDEIDAFPYKNNKELYHFFKLSLRGYYILMSATATQEEYESIQKDNGKIFLLMERYHKKPLPIPIYIKENPFPKMQVLMKLRHYIKVDKQVFIFVPTISMAEELGKFLHIFVKSGAYVSSQSPERKAIIGKFKKGLFRYLVTTSILERGVTVKNLQVVIYAGHYEIYDKDTLVQIAGRVGRKVGFEKGDVIIYGKRKTKEIQKAIDFIQNCNEKAGL